LFHERLRINDPDDGSRLTDKWLLPIVSGSISELIDGWSNENVFIIGSILIDERLRIDDSGGVS
jgi:hypothetical protein